MRDRNLLKKIIAIAFLLLVWQVAATALGKSVLLASPAAVIVRLATMWLEPGFFRPILTSFLRIVGGFFAALTFGIILASSAGKFPTLEIFFHPVFTVIKSVPVASFIIISLIWLTSANLSIFISFLMVLPVIYTNVLEGIKNTDRELLEMSAVFRITPLRRLIYIRIPQIKPYLLSACGISLGLAWKAGVAAEVIGIPGGTIGERLYNAKAYLNTVDLFAWTVIIVAVSVLFEKLFTAALNFGFRRLERTWRI